MAKVLDKPAAAERAFKAQRRIVAGCAAIRGAWVALGSELHAFHAEAMWRDLSYESFDEWLGSPEISLGRSQVYTLIEVHRQLVLERGVDQAKLQALEISKVGQVLPAIRRGDAEVDDALADCEALSRSDLREKYGKSSRSDEERTRCPACGSRVLLTDLDLDRANEMAAARRGEQEAAADRRRND